MEMFLVPLPIYGMYISQLIRLREYVLMLMNSTTEIKTRVSISLTAASSKFYHGHSELIV